MEDIWMDISCVSRTTDIIMKRKANEQLQLLQTPSKGSERTSWISLLNVNPFTRFKPNCTECIISSSKELLPILIKPFYVFYLLSLGKVNFALSSTDHKFYLLNLIRYYLNVLIALIMKFHFCRYFVISVTKLSV